MVHVHDPVLITSELSQIIINHYQKRSKEGTESLLNLFNELILTQLCEHFAGVKELEEILDAVYDSVNPVWFNNMDNRHKVRWLMKLTSVLYLQYSHKSLEKARKEREISEHRLRKGIIAAQESERRQVAVMLHDDVVQSMASALLRVQMLDEMLERKSTEISKELVELEEVIREAITSCRLLAMDRDYFLLEKAGFIPTLESYILNFENKYGIQVAIDLTDNIRIEPSISVHLFYIIREALINVQKHAEASKVIMSLFKKGNELLLRIEDNGKGFDDDSIFRDQIPCADHFGLFCIKQRVKLLGGKLYIKNAPGHGTQLIVALSIYGTELDRFVSGNKGGSPWIKSGS